MVEMALSAPEGRGQGWTQGGRWEEPLGLPGQPRHQLRSGLHSLMWASLSTVSPHCAPRSSMAFYPPRYP